LERLSYAFSLYRILPRILAGQHVKSEFSSPEEGGGEADKFIVRFAKKILPVTDHYAEDKLSTKIDGKRLVTPMLLVMIAIGATDLIFALDSIPAIFGLTQEPYIVFTANAFAILGVSLINIYIVSFLNTMTYTCYCF